MLTNYKYKCTLNYASTRNDQLYSKYKVLKYFKDI